MKNIHTGIMVIVLIGLLLINGCVKLSPEKDFCCRGFNEDIGKNYFFLV